MNTLTEAEREVLVDAYYDAPTETDAIAAVERLLAAQRKRIADDIEAARERYLRVTRGDPGHSVSQAYHHAALIARGGAE